MKEDALYENIDKDGLTIINNEQVGKTINPYYLNYNNQFYDLRLGKNLFNDVDIDLYKVLLDETRNNAKLRLKLTEEMKQNGEKIEFAAFNNRTIDLENLKPYFEKKEKTFSITYDEISLSKFVLIIDPVTQFIHIYEFKSKNDAYSSKYLHSIVDYENNVINHIDYSFNTYEKEQYNKILSNPYCKDKKAITHTKIWRLNGIIDIKDFYNIVCKMFKSNKEYIKEFFKKNY